MPLAPPHPRTLLFLGALSALCVSSLPATTLLVDGPGDGDGDGNDDFDSLHDALVAFGPLGTDGASDEVLIVVPQVHEDPEPLVNGSLATVEYDAGGPFPPLTDDLRIAGALPGGARTVVDIQPTNGFYEAFGGLDILVADGQDLLFEHLTIMPTFVGGDVQSDFVAILPGTVEAALGSSVTFRDVWLVPSLAGNVPADPTVGQSGGTQITTDFFDSHFVFRTYSVEAPLPGQRRVIDCTLEGVVFGGHDGAGTFLALRGGDVTVRDSQFVESGNDFSDASVLLTRELGGDTVVERTRLNDGAWLNLNAPQISGEVGDVRVGPGVTVEGGGTMVFSWGSTMGEAALHLAGTEQEPVVVRDASATGVLIRLGPSHSAHLEQLQVIGSAIFGILLGADGGIPLTPVTIDNTLLAFNGIDPTALSATSGRQMSLDSSGVSSSFTSLQVRISNTTFHEVGVRDGGDIDSTESIGVDDVGDRFVTHVRNTVFSGSSDEFAIGIPDPDRQSVLIQDSAIVLDGPHALGGVTTSGSVSLENVRFDDPQYASTDPFAPDAFDIFQPLWATAGPASAPLTGWGEYVAVLEGVGGVSFH